MINTFDNYLRQGKVKRRTVDPEEAKALLAQAKERLAYTGDRPITAKTATFVLQDSYEAARESAQSLMSSHGYKPYSHEATISYLKKFHAAEFTEEDIMAFDRFRKLRHDSVYKAAVVTVEEAKDCLSFSRGFLAKVGAIKPPVDGARE